MRARIDLASVGVGLVEAGIGACHLLARHRPDAMLLVGTAGVYPGQSRRLPLGAVAVVERMLLLPDLAPGTATFSPPAMSVRQRASAKITRALLRATRLPVVDAACPLAITTGRQAAILAGNRARCALENLEAFAVASAARAAGVPFAAVLGVANHVGPAGHREWKRHGREAAAAACDAVLAFLVDRMDAKPQRARRKRRAPRRE